MNRNCKPLWFQFINQRFQENGDSFNLFFIFSVNSKSRLPKSDSLFFLFHSDKRGLIIQLIRCLQTGVDCLVRLFPVTYLVRLSAVRFYQDFRKDLNSDKSLAIRWYLPISERKHTSMIVRVGVHEFACR